MKRFVFAFMFVLAFVGFAEKNAAGEFVFSDYPYWEKSE